MADERKTLGKRAQMTEIERLRHSAAHALATAICCHPEQSRRISHYFVIPSESPALSEVEWVEESVTANV
jgi:hypothetical protein